MALRDAIAGVVIFAFSLTAFVMSFSLRGGAELFPRIVAGIMLLCSVLLIVRGVVWPTEGERLTPGEMRRVGLSMILTIAYVVLLAPVGYITMSLIYIPTAAYLLGLRRHVLIWVTTIAFVFAVYYFFDRIVYTPLPRELIMQLF